MATTEAMDTYDAYARRIERWRGVSIRDRIATGRNGHIIDFTIEWPDVQYAEPDDIRYEAIEASAIIWRKPEHVKEWQLRLPPLPVEGNPEDETASTLERGLLGGYYGPEEIMVMMADGEQAWTPHVQPQGWTPHVRTAEDVLDIVNTIITNYYEMAAPNGVL